jgi:hypothetical protein
MSNADAALVEPFLILGQRRRACLERVLSERIEVWRRGWSTGREPIQSVVIDSVDPTVQRAQHDASVAICAASAVHGTLMQLCAGPEALSGLLGMTVPGAERRSAAGAQSVVVELELTLARSLCEELLHSAGVADAVLDSKRIAATRETGGRNGCLSVVVSAAGRPRLALWLTPRCVELLAPPQPPANVQSPRMERRKSAIGDERVRMEAILGDVEIDFRDLVQLAAGDVIVLEQSLSGTAQLATLAGVRLAQVQLGSVGGLRAVSVIK